MTRPSPIHGSWLLGAMLASCVPVPQAWIEARQKWHWSYPAPVAATGPATVPETLHVVDLVDARPTTNDWRLLVALIPLVPYATSVFDRPETAVRGIPLPEFAPVADVTTALVAELRAARIFAAVSHGPHRDADWVLDGELLATRCAKDDIHYGLSILGVVPWLFGCPNAVTDDEISVRVTLRRRGRPQPVWSHDLRAADTGWYWAYSGSIDFRFDALLRSAMPAFLTELRRTVRSIPAARRE